MTEDVYKTLGQLEATVSAAHKRLDKHEAMVASELQQIHALMSELNNWMQQNKGRSDFVKYTLGFIGGGTLLTLVKFISTGAFL